jgi:CRISPR-associated endonuclease/helicase Cas3
MLDRSLVVVATQTIEAGVDIDLDGLVTEAAALDALRQRFGRLNRAGRFFTPIATVVAHRDDITAKADDPIYRDRISRTWMELCSFAPDREVDFGLQEFAGRVPPKKASELAAPTEDAPVLLPAYAHLWSHTSPIPNADPEAGLFLHGPDRSPASVQIVWRADIGRGDVSSGERERLIALLGLLPPRSGEAIEVPLWAARTWLGEYAEPLSNLSDAADRAPEDPSGLSSRPAVRYAGRDDARSGVVQPNALRTGDLIVVPRNKVVAGAGPEIDRAGNISPRPGLIAPVAAVRVTPEFRQEVPDTPVKPEPSRRPTSMQYPACIVDPGSPAGGGSHIARCGHGCRARLHLSDQMRTYLEALRDRKGRLDRVFAYNYDEGERPSGVVFVAPRGLRNVQDVDELAAAPSTESDELGSAAGYAQPLDEHSNEVAACARHFGRRAGLGEAKSADLALAAYLHDDLAQVLFRLSIQVDVARKLLDKGRAPNRANVVAEERSGARGAAGTVAA